MNKYPPKICQEKNKFKKHPLLGDFFLKNFTWEMGAVGVGGVKLDGLRHPQKDPYEDGNSKTDAKNVALHAQ
jgi:hypothetical protein